MKASIAANAAILTLRDHIGQAHNMDSHVNLLPLVGISVL
jgi:hypothetical protein